MIVLGYVRFYQTNKLFINILFFHHWQNVFAGRSLESPELDVEEHRNDSDIVACIKFPAVVGPDHASCHPSITCQVLCQHPHGCLPHHASLRYATGKFCALQEISSQFAHQLFAFTAMSNRKHLCIVAKTRAPGAEPSFCTNPAEQKTRLRNTKPQIALSTSLCANKRVIVGKH